MNRKTWMFTAMAVLVMLMGTFSMVQSSESDAVSDVASIGGVGYPSVQDAIDASADGNTIVLLSDIKTDKGVWIDKPETTINLDLNGHTYIVTDGQKAADDTPTNNRGFKINSGNLNVFDSSPGKTGTMIAVGDHAQVSGVYGENGTAYGVFRVESNGTLNLNGITLINSDDWGLNVKVLGGKATLTGVKIYSYYGGGIEVTEANLGTHSQTGEATMTDCIVIQKHIAESNGWLSSAVTVSGGGKLIVDSGSYVAEGYGAYVYSSGGDITINSGVISGDINSIRADLDIGSYPNYSGSIKITGGNFNGPVAITPLISLKVTGGSFDSDTILQYVPDGYRSSLIGERYYVSIEPIPTGTNSFRSEEDSAVVDVASSAVSISLPSALFEINGSSSIGSISVSIEEQNVPDITGAIALYDITIVSTVDYSADITVDLIIPKGEKPLVYYIGENEQLIPVLLVDYTSSSVTFRTDHNTPFVILTETIDQPVITEDEDYPFFPWNGNNQGTIVTPSTPVDESSDDNTKAIAAAAAIVVIMLAAVALMVNRNN